MKYKEMTLFDMTSGVLATTVLTHCFMTRAGTSDWLVLSGHPWLL